MFVCFQFLEIGSEFVSNSRLLKQPDKFLYILLIVSFFDKFPVYNAYYFPRLTYNPVFYAFIPIQQRLVE